MNSIIEDLPDVQDTINDDFIKNKIDKLEDLGHGDIENIIPMENKEFLTEASKIYNEQRKMGEQIYVEKMVDLSDIVTRQEWLDKDTLIDFIKYDKSKEKGDLIRAVYYKNKYMLIDGNHRVAMAILKGGKRIKIAVLNPIKK